MGPERLAATMREEFEVDPPVWIWQVEGSGSVVETDLLDAARRNWARMLSYAQRFDQDSAVAANILEAVLLATSRARKGQRQSGKPIRNLDSYLYVAFIRRFHRYLAKQPRLVYVGTDQDLDARTGARTRSTQPTIEDHLLAGELIQFMNQRARNTFYFREIAGYNWKDTARFLKTTVNSAQVLFNKAYGGVRDRIMRRKGSGRPGKGGEPHA